MAVTVQTAVTDNQALVPFFYLRITGLPFYVFATINPSDTRYGSFAWSAPTGFPSTWAQRGLQLPDDAIDQKFTDIIGGVATPGRIKLSVIDFPDPNHVGKGFFSRLFAPGRAVSDSSIAQAILANDVASDIGADSVLEIEGQTGTFTLPSDVYVGAETIGITARDVGPPITLEFSDRNKYVCYGNRADGGNYWPPDPYHTVLKDSTNNVTSVTQVTAEAMDVIGRTAALWMGHMRPDGNPEPETSSACLLLGRVTDLGIGKIGGMFDITVESIVADLTKGKVAPDLAHATIQDGFYLGGSADSRTFYIYNNSTSLANVTISAQAYSVQSLTNEINTKMAVAGVHYITLKTAAGPDGNVFMFEAKSPGVPVILSTVPINADDTPDVPGAASLLYALGFDPTVPSYRVEGIASSNNSVTAQRPVARVFVPCYNTSQGVHLSDVGGAGRFFTDPGDGSAKAWARFGDGQLVALSATDTSTNSVTTGGAFGGGAVATHSNSGNSGFGKFYYCDQGSTPTIDQVVFYIQQSTTGSYTKFLGRLLASTKGHSSASDGILNVYAKGVGMGWQTLLTANDWLQADETGLVRLVYVDAATKWIDLFTPFAREHGLFLTWNPSTNGISLRRIIVPQAASAGTNVTFSESNRARSEDRTSQRVDRSSIRTSWKIKPAFRFDGFSQEPPALVINDTRARSMYPNDDRQEDISDSTLVASDGMSAIVLRLLLMYGSPWTKCSRSMNKGGMLLSPGTIHKVIDNTLINPFTGATGIVTGDDVYCFLTRASVTPAEGEVTIEFVINSTDDNSLYRKWSPTALVDFTLNTGGYTRGYNSSNKTLRTSVAYGTDGDGDGSEFYFSAGDTVRIINRDSSGGSSASQTDTIVDASDGVITLTTGISPLSSVSETIVVLQKYNSSSAARQTGATKVAWQGDGDTRVIQGSSTARLNKWS